MKSKYINKVSTLLFLALLSVWPAGSAFAGWANDIFDECPDDQCGAPPSGGVGGGGAGGGAPH